MFFSGSIRSKVCVAFTVVALTLSACGGGGGNSEAAGGASAAPQSGAVLSGNYFPTSVGSKWIYSTSGQTKPRTMRVLGTQPVGSETGYVFATTSDTDGSLVSDDIYVLSNSGVRVFTPPGSDPVTQALDGIVVLPSPLVVGATIQQKSVTVDAGFDFDGDGKSDQVALVASLTVLGVETVNTDAGEFREAVHTRETVDFQLLPSGGGQPLPAKRTIDAWFADGIGEVRRVERNTGHNYDDTTTMTLLAYAVGDKRSDTTPLNVIAVTPGDVPARGATTFVSVNFNKPIDPDSIKSQTITVFDRDNVRIPGTVQVSGNVLTFIAGGSWATGTYTATLATDVKDVLGNTLAAPKVWRFAIDATGPTVASVSPANGAQNVGTGTSVQITFSEPPDPASIDPGLVYITDGDAHVETSVSVSGSTVTLTPKQPLQQRRTYSVSVSGVMDLVGNPLGQGFVSQFLTTQGLFAYPVAVDGLPVGSSVVAMATGDINGDGYTDIVLSTSNIVNSTDMGVYVSYGRAGGTRSTPKRMDIGALGRCEVSSIALGDANGDSRSDLVLGAGSCGIQVLYQSTDGSLVLGESLDRYTVGVVRIAAFDRSGKAAVVATGFDGNILIWTRAASGNLQFSQVLSSGESSIRDVAIGDLNNDGLPDIAAVVSGYVLHNLSVILQTPGGGFSPPRLFASSGGWTATLAIADFNGDGRSDLVVSGGGNSPTYISVFYQAAGGELGPETKVSSYDIPFKVIAADINRDGLTDIVVSHQGWGTVGVYFQQPNGLLAPEKKFNAPYGSWNIDLMSVGDVNNDGSPDIVIDGSVILQIPQSGFDSSRASGKSFRQTLQQLVGKQGAVLPR